MKSINKKLLKAKLKNYNIYIYIYIKREQEQVLNLNNKAPKCMANASFYRPKFGIIDLMTNYWVGDQLLTWWKSLSSYLKKTSLLASDLEPHVLMKVIGNCLIFPGKKIKAIWTSGTRDMSWTLNSA